VRNLHPGPIGEVAAGWSATEGSAAHAAADELGNWNSVYRQFPRWTISGVWDVLLQALADSGGEADALQMIDSTTVRAHHCAAGAKGGLRDRLDARPATVRHENAGGSMRRYQRLIVLSQMGLRREAVATLLY
jgi:transposase